jgi:hypothetical protein
MDTTNNRWVDLLDEVKVLLLWLVVVLMVFA